MFNIQIIMKYTMTNVYRRLGQVIFPSLHVLLDDSGCKLFFSFVYLLPLETLDCRMSFALLWHSKHKSDAGFMVSMCGRISLHSA